MTGAESLEYRHSRRLAVEVYCGLHSKVTNIMAKEHSFASVKRVDSEEDGENTAELPSVAKMHASTVKNYRDAIGMLAY